MPPPSKPAAKLGLSASTLALIFSDVPHALDGQTLTVTYPSLAAYEARAQADLTALAELADVRASSVSAANAVPSEYQSADALRGPQTLTVLLSH